MTTIVRCAGLKKWFAQLREIGLANTNAGIFDRESEFLAMAHAHSQ